MLNPATCASLGLEDPPASASGKGAVSRAATQIKGIGGTTANRLPARRCQLAEARIGPATFAQVQAVYHGASSSGSGNGGSGSSSDGQAGGLVLSHHTSGIVCAGLLGRCSLLFDYAHMRLKVLAHTP
jgi:hypothetical protein